jgi:LAGLIDADG DNA endonuclease family protein
MITRYSFAIWRHHLVDAKYLAGFFDGEGSVCITENSGSLTVGVHLPNNYKPVLDQVKSQFGGGLYKQAGTKCWKWSTLRADTSFIFLTYIYQYLIIKKKEVEIALAFLSTVKSQGETGHMGYTDQELLLREKLYEMFTEAAKERKRPHAK